VELVVWFHARSYGAFATEHSLAWILFVSVNKLGKDHILSLLVGFLKDPERLVHQLLRLKKMPSPTLLILTLQIL